MSSSPNCLPQTDDFISRQWRTAAFPGQKQKVGWEMEREQQFSTGTPTRVPPSSCFHLNLRTGCASFEREKKNRKGPAFRLIYAQMCRLKIRLEARSMLHGWALAEKWNSLNTQRKKKPVTQWDKGSTARIRVGRSSLHPVRSPSPHDCKFINFFFFFWTVWYLT